MISSDNRSWNLYKFRLHVMTGRERLKDKSLYYNLRTLVGVTLINVVSLVGEYV